MSSGALFRAVVAAKPVQILGTINAYCALQAEKEGFASVCVWICLDSHSSSGAKAIYLSGSGVATSSYGLPDLGITDMNDVLTDVRRITRFWLFD